MDIIKDCPLKATADFFAGKVYYDPSHDAFYLAVAHYGNCALVNLKTGLYLCDPASVDVITERMAEGEIRSVPAELHVR